MTATNEPIEKKKKAPVISNDALLSAAELASIPARFNWSEDEYGRGQIQLYFPHSGREITAPSNVWVISKLLNRHELMEQMIADLQHQLESKDNA